MRILETVLSASLLLAALAGAALAQECWEDMTPAACPVGTAQILKFKNSCPGTKTVNVCLKWTSGEQANTVKRFKSSAQKDKIAEINVGQCNSGQFNYTHNEDGSEPGCPQ
jgi:hypothetical protein